MTVDRRFLLAAICYAVVGMTLGEIMGASGDHGQMPTHAHIMLLGWASMGLFALIYKTWPAMGGSLLAPVHFWLFQAGALLQVICLFLLYGGQYEKAVLGPFLGFASLLLISSVLIFGWNAFKNGRG